MTEYVRGLVSDLSRMYRSEGRDVKLIVHVDAIGLDLDVATPCGIILNELITNALKHAFAKWPEGGGEIRVSFKRTGGSFALTVADNGVGLPDLSALDHTTSLGWVLIRALGEQIGGQIHVDGSRGVSCTVVFPARGLRAPLARVSAGAPPSALPRVRRAREPKHDERLVGPAQRHDVADRH